jgi:hypothetical protein
MNGIKQENKMCEDLEERIAALEYTVNHLSTSLYFAVQAITIIGIQSIRLEKEVFGEDEENTLPTNFAVPDFPPEFN